MTSAEVSSPQALPATPTAPAASAEHATSALQVKNRTPMQKCHDVLKVLLRAFNEVRRLLRDSAAEIGEIVGGDLGREVGRIGASVLLGLMSETLLGEDDHPSIGEVA